MEIFSGHVQMSTEETLGVQCPPELLWPRILSSQYLLAQIIRDQSPERNPAACVVNIPLTPLAIGFNGDSGNRCWGKLASAFEGGGCYKID